MYFFYIYTEKLPNFGTQTKILMISIFWMIPYIVRYHSKYKNFQELFDFDKKSRNNQILLC